MKPTPNSPPDLPILLAFGAHPDDVEFGCGGIVAQEAAGGRRVHVVVTSRGEAGTHGTPAERESEARRGARRLGVSVEFIELDGDAHLEVKAAHALKLAAIIRKVRPGIVLAPTLEPNQHPDHWRLGALVRDATRLARYGGLAELKSASPHAISQLLYYAITAEAEPGLAERVVIDISAAAVVRKWTAAMEAHASQMKTRRYVELQLARARVQGLSAGVEYAQCLYPNDPLVFDSLRTLERQGRNRI